MVDRLDITLIESELQEISPTPLSGGLLETLSAIPLEAEFTELAPTALSSDFLDKLEATVEGVEKEALASKVISFPRAEEKKDFNWKWLSTAAAVAVLGVITGLGMFKADNSEVPQFTKNETPFIPETFTPQPISQNGLVNVSLNSTVVDTTDHGLVKGQRNEYSRAIKVVSMETCTIKNKQGKSIIVQKPVEKIILVPATTD